MSQYTKKNYIPKPSGVCLILGLIASLGLIIPSSLAILSYIISISLFFALFLNSRIPENNKISSGFVFSYGFFLISLHWISSSIYYEWENFWWSIPFILFGIPALLSLPFGAFSYAIVRFFNKTHVLYRSLIIPVLFSFSAYIGGIITNFPWTLFGLPFFIDETESYFLSNLVQLFGINGFAFLLTYFSSLIATVFKEKKIGGGLLAFHSSWMILLSYVISPEIELTNTPVALIQPCINQDLKWNPAFARKNLSTLYAFSHEAQVTKPSTYLIWPETAIPYLIEDKYGKFTFPIPGGYKYWFLGAQTYAKFSKGEKLYNSILIINKNNEVEFIYHKNNLVPVIEGFPFAEYLNEHFGINNWFEKGKGCRTFHENELLSVSPLVCYDIIFSNNIVEKDDRPQWIVNLTNDAWYYGPVGPRQHMAIARVRALEQGIPVVRCANNGISCIIAPDGSLVKYLEHNEAGVVTGYIPKPLGYSTLYAMYHELTYLGIIILISLIHLLCSYTWLKYNKRKDDEAK